MPPYHHSVKESVIWSVKRGQMYVFTFIFMLGVKEDQIEDDTTFTSQVTNCQMHTILKSIHKLALIRNELAILTLPNLALHHKFYMAADGRCMEII